MLAETKSNEGGLIPRGFCALAFENKLEYHNLYSCINSSDDQATSGINLVGFWPVPPEFIFQHSSLFIHIHQMVARLCFAGTC